MYIRINHAIRYKSLSLWVNFISIMAFKGNGIKTGTLMSYKIFVSFFSIQIPVLYSYFEFDSLGHSD